MVAQGARSLARTAWKVARIAGLVSLSVSMSTAAHAQPSDSPVSGIDRITLFTAPTIVVKNAQLFDGSGAPPRVGQSILIRGGRIEAIGPDDQIAIPEGALVKDVQGAAVAPGFVLMHEHLFYPVEGETYGSMIRSFPPLYLAGGVTTLRTAGSMTPYADLNSERDIASGDIAGPDIDVTAPFLNGDSKLRFLTDVKRIRSPKDADRMVRYWADEGATSYKGYMHLTRAQLAAVVAAAHARQAKVTAHLCSITYREAVDMGIDNLEHGFMVSSDFVAGKKPDDCPAGNAVSKSLDQLAVDDPAMRALQRHLIERRVALTSTLTIFETFANGRPMAPQGALDLLIPQLREQYVTRYSAIQRGGPNVWTRLLPKAMAWEKQFNDGGGLLTAGTDPTGYGGVVPGYSSTRQMELLIEAGFDAAGAIKVMTLNGARYLQRDKDVGSLVVGKRADLVVFQKGIGTEMKVLPPIAWTMKEGRAFDRERILSMWKGRVGLQ